MMNEKALKTIQQYNMISKGDTVAVCLSGGADSMALFHFLCFNRQNLGIKVMALHVNHGLRSESEQEEVFVKNYCEKLGTPCVVMHGDMNSKPKPQGMSTELWARQLRYDFFFECAKKYSAKLATAHTLSDRVETVLFNITRGSGIKGASGIPPIRDNIIRPLIDCTRSEIEKYCADNEISFVSDSTNFEDIYSRNKIRLNVIPVLKQINPSAERLIGAFAKENEEVYTLLTQLSDNLYRKSVGVNGIDVRIINAEHPAVIKNLLRNQLDKLRCLSKENIDSLYNALSLKEYKRQLSSDIFCEIKDNHLFFYSPSKPKSPDEGHQCTVILDERINFLGSDFIFSVISYKEYEKIKENRKNYLTYCVNYDKIKNALILRTRKTHDTFTFTKRNVTKSLKKLFIEDKIPPSQREKTAVLSDENGKVIWLMGYGVNKDYAADQNTKNILLISQL